MEGTPAPLTALLGTGPTQVVGCGLKANCKRAPSDSDRVDDGTARIRLREVWHRGRPQGRGWENHEQSCVPQRHRPEVVDLAETSSRTEEEDGAHSRTLTALERGQLGADIVWTRHR